MLPTADSGAQPSSSDAPSTALRSRLTSAASPLSCAAVAGLAFAGLTPRASPWPWRRSSPKPDSEGLPPPLWAHSTSWRTTWQVHGSWPKLPSWSAWRGPCRPAGGAVGLVHAVLARCGPRGYWRAGEGLRGKVGGGAGSRRGWWPCGWGRAGGVESLGGGESGSGLGGALLGL